MSIIRAFTRKSAAGLAAATMAVVFMQPDVVVAQEKGRALEEIVVTAQRRAQSLQEVPLAVEVYAGSEIRRQGFRDLDDLANFSPTVLIEPRVQDQDVAIRGFGTTGNTLTHDQAAPFFVDGIHFGRQSQVKLAFLDVESLEVLKGPQPVYFGQNATAGAFNIRSKRPTDTWEGYVNLEASSNSTEELTFGVGGPINDQWGIRIAGVHENTDGYMKYVATGKPIGNYENNGGRVMLQFTPNDKLQITAKLESMRIRKDGETFYSCLTGDSMLYGRDGGIDPTDGPGNELSVWNQDPGLGTPWGQPIMSLDREKEGGCFKSNKATSQGGPYFDAPPRTSELTDSRFGLPPSETGVRQYSGDGGFVDMRVAANGVAKSSGNNGILGYEDLDGIGSFVEVNYQFDNEMSLEWLSGTSDYERDYAIDNRNGPFFTNFQGRGEDFSQWSTELRLRSASGKRVEWEVGGFFQHTELTAFSSSLRANVRQSQRYNDISEEVDFTSYFANVTINVTDTFAIDIGGRQMDVDKFAAVEGYAASWIFAVCPEDPCDPGLTPVSVQFDPELDGYAGCEGSVEDGRGRDRDVYCLVDPSTARLFAPVPDGASLYAMPFRETRYVPLAWNSGYATPVGMTAPDYAVRVDRGEGPYGEKFTESGFSPQVSLRWNIRDNISVYARYAESFKIGGFDTGQSSIPTSVDELTFETEDAEQIEIGIKGTLMEGRMSFDADIFELEFPNLQVSVLSPDPEQTSAAGNAGQRVRGFEFNTRFAATDNLILGFAGALMDGEMTRFPGAGCTDAEIGDALTDPSAPCGFYDDDGVQVLPPVDVGDVGDLTAIIDRTNLPAPRVPDWKFILSADYIVPFGGKYEFNLNAKGFISDGYIVDVEGFEQIVDYRQHEDMNVMVGIRNIEAGWGVSAFARNILEARPSYHAENDRFPTGMVSQYLSPNAFSSYGVKFEYMFE
jgi:outer membrane receptor protein involved in Fe transport